MVLSQLIHFKYHKPNESLISKAPKSTQTLTPNSINSVRRTHNQHRVLEPKASHNANPVEKSWKPTKNRQDSDENPAEVRLKSGDLNQTSKQTLEKI